MTISSTRRAVLLATTAGLFAGAAVRAFAAGPPQRLEAVPARFVSLRPSVFADAQAANRAYLVSLSPDRLLHNFHRSAGLPPRGQAYGGWEALSLAGHTLGHYLSACALTVANTGDPLLRQRLTDTVAEMARIQAAHGDGYLAGSTLWSGADGKSVYEDLRRGRIEVESFSLNGGWAPLYNWHKLHAGLLDAHGLAGTPRALEVALGLAGYLATLIEGLSDEQVQKVLVAEHGGLCEAYVQTYALTGQERWLRIARRLRHRAVLEPLEQGRDALAGLHANTQIPKIIGLARLHELTGDPAAAGTARFFHRIVTEQHSYVIGGNSDREHFAAPGKIAGHISETTCEACNSYNMLKLTRHLYAWEPRASLFDSYERTQINHILAHQRPDTGRFVYFMPMAAGARRSYSTATDSFWCCVGTGMESHAKHADSIYWQGAGTLYVNLFIPSRLTLPDEGFELELDTAYPMDGAVRLTILRAPRRAQEIALRLPGWCATPMLRLNGAEIAVQASAQGYARLNRRWRAGDKIELVLPMTLRAEPTPDDPNLVAFLSGPLVLAADLGPADRPFERSTPALIGDAPPANLLRPAAEPHHFKAKIQDGEALFRPFFNQYDRRTAVYAPVFSRARWAAEGESFLQRERARIELAARTVDAVYLGEQQPEIDHGVVSAGSEIFQLNGRSGRRVGLGGHLEVRLKRPGAATLQLVCWGADVGQKARVFLDGAPAGVIELPGRATDGFVTQDHPLPAAAGDGAVRLRLEPIGRDLALYEVRILRTPSAST
jgi:hypothetical protein